MISTMEHSHSHDILYSLPKSKLIFKKYVKGQKIILVCQLDQCYHECIMVRIVWAISFNSRILKPWWPHIPPVHMVNQSTLDVGCFSHKLFESRILQAFCDGVCTILGEAKIQVSCDEIGLTVINQSFQGSQCFRDTSGTGPIDVDAHKLG